MNPCIIARDAFGKWISSGSESSTLFRKFSLETSRRLSKEYNKGFITIEFDTPDEAIAYIIFTPEKHIAYNVIDRNAIPNDFLYTYDNIDMDTHFLLYIVFGKTHSGCVSIMREICG